ncbi:Sec-independent protein translocase subunit TatA/TatB [Adhaeretor mobilis]|uniref:Sec-independent protein translocase protein TatA n=1 Tax=Adhaeretor mobilis TaxID=1930276 RepID=A0A517MYG9_9BACT|nr:twin-arginine translocase TatA/TatE family subunit [Adhaeretor mobilis]QDS99925.1 twin arginine translocase protein A [Adhaeretor mobilis]
MFTPGPLQLFIVGLIVLLLFGNRLPSVMRSLGEGITEFKKGVSSDDEGKKIEEKTESPS